MLRCALYARYSSDRQNERSIADQVALCQRRADDLGWSVVRIFSDAAISGQAMANRPGLLDALAAAERGELDVLLTEDEDRIARDLEHLAHINNRLRDAGAALHTLSSGEVLTMHVAIKGLMAEDYIRNLSAKTKRGMHANAEKGLATGARTYGYRSQPGGEMTIVEDQAAVVRRIFADYVAGETPRRIAAALNAEGVPSPAGGLWNASTIHGSRQRGAGILHCELFVGVKVWNRYDVRKDRRTGKRTSRPIPADQWKRTAVPHLRILDDALWAAARARKARTAESRPETNRRYPGVFSGLLKCACGATYTAYSSGKLICAAYRERGPAACDNRRTPKRADVERLVLQGLRDQLMSAEAVAAYVRAYHHAAQARARHQVRDRAPFAKRLAEIDRQSDRLVDAIARGVANPAMEARLTALQGERQTTAQQLAQVDDAAEPPFTLNPRSAEIYGEMIAELQATLADYLGDETPSQRQLKEAVRGLIERVVIRPRTQLRGGPIDVVVEGRITDFLSAGEEPDENVGCYALVAGARSRRTAPNVPLRIQLRM